MKYRVVLNDDIELLVVADSEVEAVRKAKCVKDAIYNHKRVADSDQLRQLAYQLGQLANYFDRSNSAHSRNLLSDKDKQKLTEFYNLGLKVYDVLKKEVESLKRASADGKVERFRPKSPLDSWSNTEKLLNDAINRMYWTREPKLVLLSKKLDALVTEYGNTIRGY